MNKTEIPPSPVTAPVPNPKKRSLFIAGGMIIAIILIIEIIWARSYMKGLSLPNTSPQKNTGGRRITPAPLAQGKQMYFVRSGDKTGPQITEVSVDPFDPKQKERQVIEAKISSAVPVAEALLILKTDNGSKTSPFHLSSGSATMGVWSATAVTDDTHDYLYQAVISASDGQKTNKIELTFR